MADFLTPAERSSLVESVDVSGMAVPLTSVATLFDSDPARIWSSQPAVRKVVDFIASNVASIPLHVYARTKDGRFRVRDGDLAKLLADPSKSREETPYLFWKRVIIDWLLYDEALVFIDDLNTALRRVPPTSYVVVRDPVYGTVTQVKIMGPRGLFKVRPLDEFLFWSGYSIPGWGAVSPMKTLKAILEESSEALAFRQMMWKRQATHTGVVERGEAWESLEARDNFLQGLRTFDAASERSGGTMLLDEGMTWKDRKPSFTPSDLDDIEARQLTDVEVASLFHIAPEMLGIRQGNYSNMEAFRQSLYRDSLGPYISGWEQALTPLVGLYGKPGQYVEAFLDAKLRGSFEEQAQTFQTSVGAPVMTRNEARAKMNLPFVEDGDELVTPLNVLVGGQASPTDSGFQNLRSAPPVEVKGAPLKSVEYTPEMGVKTREVLSKFFERQKVSVLSAIAREKSVVPGGPPEWWQQERWDNELAEDLFRVAATFSPLMGRAQTEALGMSGDAYVPELTFKYLRGLAARRAAGINLKTYEGIEAALLEKEPVADVFDKAVDVRAGVASAAYAAAVSSWTAKEVGQQILGGEAWKQWNVTSGNPRDSHAAMDGEVVPFDARFSNGQFWPGDSSAGVEETAGCMCGVTIGRGPW